MAVAMIGPKFYAWDRNGKPLAFGKLYTYQARTNVPKPTYQSEDQVVENSNPVILNGEGYANVYLEGSYKMVLKDDKDNEIWSSDPVSSAYGNEWIDCFVAEYLSPSSLRIAGNLVDRYKEGTSVRLEQSLPDYQYNIVSDSSYSGGFTTIILNEANVTTDINNICRSVSSNNSSLNYQGIGSFVSYYFENLSKMKDGIAIGESGVISFSEGMVLSTINQAAYGDNAGGTYYVSTTEEDNSIELSTGLFANPQKKDNRESIQVVSNKKLNRALVSFSFDGAFNYNFDELAGLLRSKNVQIAYAVPVADIRFLGDGGVSNTDIVTMLKAQEIDGHEFFNHGLTTLGVDGSALPDNTLWQEMTLSQQILRQNGINVTDWISYRSSIDPENIPYALKNHAIVYGQAANTNAQNPESCVYDWNTSVNQNVGVLRSSLENVTKSDGSTATSPTDRLIAAKQVVDYCVENNKGILFNHHAADNGAFGLTEIGELIDYARAQGAEVVKPSMLWDELSNVKNHGVKLQALENDVGAVMSQTHENLLEEANIDNWTQNPLQGNPVITTTVKPYSIESKIEFDGSQTSGNALILESEPIVQLFGNKAHLDELCFALDYISNQDEGGIDLIVKYFTDEAGTVLYGEYEDTFDRVGSNTRKAKIVVPNNFKVGGVRSMRLALRIRAKSATATEMNIQNLCLSRGSYPAKYQHPVRLQTQLSFERATLDTQVSIVNVDMAEGDSAFYNKGGNLDLSMFKRVTFVAGATGNNEIRGISTYDNPTTGRTYEVVAVGGTSSTFTITATTNGFEFTSSTSPGTYVLRDIILTLR